MLLLVIVSGCLCISSHFHWIWSKLTLCYTVIYLLLNALVWQLVMTCFYCVVGCYKIINLKSSKKQFITFRTLAINWFSSVNVSLLFWIVNKPIVELDDHDKCLHSNNAVIAYILWMKYYGDKTNRFKLIYCSIVLFVIYLHVIGQGLSGWVLV